MLQVKVTLVSAEAERICIDRMVKGQDKPFSNPEGLAEIDSRMASLVRGHNYAQHCRPSIQIGLHVSCRLGFVS